MMKLNDERGRSIQYMGSASYHPCTMRKIACHLFLLRTSLTPTKAPLSFRFGRGGGGGGFLGGGDLAVTCPLPFGGGDLTVAFALAFGGGDFTTGFPAAFGGGGLFTGGGGDLGLGLGGGGLRGGGGCFWTLLAGALGQGRVQSGNGTITRRTREEGNTQHAHMDLSKEWKYCLACKG